MRGSAFERGVLEGASSQPERPARSEKKGTLSQDYIFSARWQVFEIEVVSTHDGLDRREHRLNAGHAASTGGATVS